MPTDNGIVLWYYGSENEESEGQVIECIRYRDIEMKIIETAYQQRKSEVLLDKFHIDLDKCIQFNRADSPARYLVKHETNCRREDSLRNERFFSPPSLISAPSYGSAQTWCPFLSSWLNSPPGKKALFDFSSSVDACINGILFEAAQHRSDSEAEANWMVGQLRACQAKPRREVTKVCVHLYTRESFLYRVLNTGLRNGDQSKLETMGPLCFLIQNHSHTCRDFVGTVYRGVNLSTTAIATYKQAVGLWRTWSNFTSTSKNKKMAEIRGNTLFVITITTTKFSAGIRANDISEISQFPSEEEVLLRTGVSFQIIRVDQTLDEKNIIEIKM